MRSHAWMRPRVSSSSPGTCSTRRARCAVPLRPGSPPAPTATGSPSGCEGHVRLQWTPEQPRKCTASNRRCARWVCALARGGPRVPVARRGRSRRASRRWCRCLRPVERTPRSPAVSSSPSARSKTTSRARRSAWESPAGRVSPRGRPRTASFSSPRPIRSGSKGLLEIHPFPHERAHPTPRCL